MATPQRKPAQPPVVGTRRPALRATADTAPVSPAVPSTSDDMQIEAVRIISREDGFRDGFAKGVASERARLTTEESLEERMRRIVSRTCTPRTQLAIDHITSWMLYAFGASMVVGFGVLVWRIFRWI